MEEWPLDRGFSEIRIILTTMSVRSSGIIDPQSRQSSPSTWDCISHFSQCFFYQPKLQFRSVYCFAIKCKKKKKNNNNNNNNKKKQENLIYLKSYWRGSHRAYKEGAPSVKLLQQNMIRIVHAKINGRTTVNLKISALRTLTHYIDH